MLKTILKQVASLLIILGIIIIIPGIVAIMYAEWYSFAGFTISGLLISLFGYANYKCFEEANDPTYQHSLIIAASGWLAIMIFGAIPYYVIAHLTPLEVMQAFVPAGQNYTSSLLNFKNPLHALFESTSAFTTTGLTMAYNEPSVGKAILFYRSFSQWVGGAGFIVMALAVFENVPGRSAVLLYGSESSGTKLKSNVIETARSIWKVYFLVTFIMFLYILIGTLLILPDYGFYSSLFDAINHAMTGQSTGGFSVLDDSIAGYNSAKMDYLFILPMLLGGLSIPFFFRFIFLRKFSELWTDIQTRAILIASVLGSIGLTVLLFNSEGVNDPVREGIFQFVSALSTTGWQTSNIGGWSDLPVLFIVSTAMIIGGSAGGTVGGIKIIRALLLQKGLRWHINKIFHSKNTIKSVKFDDNLMLPARMNKELANAGVFVLIYLLFVFFSTLITIYFMGTEYSMADAIFESASAQGTVGLSSGITDPSMHPILETVYIIQMWAGRLEVIPVLVLLRVAIYGMKKRKI